MPKRRAARKTNEEIRQIVAGFEPSELTRAAYAELHGITVAALDGCRRRLRMRSGGFVEVAVSGEPCRETFAIALANGRRIEIGWADVALAAGQWARLHSMAAGRVRAGNGDANFRPHRCDGHADGILRFVRVGPERMGNGRA